ncbi:uncharacterized protein LOC111002731 isoform X1 [Pieris rapae]|uniref:uncharacterized protein LOC111002731 isoform X1 n=1 Tax=Pieris rapae TaxID=64459 RepID=UPI001E27C696|nr:uncharacterized protein LOC111002731 isoform X1 [Pieris rapae]
MRFLLCLLFSLLPFVFSQTISNVRLVDHTSYIVELVQKTIDRVQKNHWNGLKVHDVTIEIDEEILNKTVKGTVSLSNGFIVSMQHLTLVPSTIQQVWLYTRATNTTTLELRSTMQMTDIAIGFDVDGTLDGENYHNTVTIIYPSMQFKLALIRNLFTDELSSRAEPVLRRTTNKLQFLPSDNFSQVLVHLYDWNSTFPSLQTWANEVFAPIILDVAETEHPIPGFCYDCPAY